MMKHSSSALHLFLYLASAVFLLVACNPAPANNAQEEPNPKSAGLASPPSLQTNEQLPLGQAYTFDRAGLSLQPPKDWISKQLLGLNYTAFVSDATEMPTASITLIEDAYPGALTEYIETNLKAIAKAFKQFKRLNQSEFKTNSGIVGVAIASESEQLGQPVRQIFYFFTGKDGKKLVFTCSFAAKESEKLAPLCAASLQTLKLAN
jgi:hypothetical protein